MSAPTSFRQCSDATTEEPIVSIHQLKVILTGIAPPIWRRVHVRSDATLAELHGVLRDAMGWRGRHLHAFGLGWTRYGDGEGRNENAATLAAVLSRQGDRMIYTYDFRDNSHHTVEVEKIQRPQPGATYPRCSAGRRASPPENSGGPCCYTDMLTAIRARKGPRYREIREWGDHRHDPKGFDLAAINATLAEASAELSQPG